MIYLLLFLILLILIYYNKDLISIKIMVNVFLTFILLIVSIFMINSILISGPYKWMEIAHENDWISFWGSLIGGIFGGVATLIVIILTKKENQENLKATLDENKRYYFDENLKSVRPYMIIDDIDILKLEDDPLYNFEIQDKDNDSFIIHKSLIGGLCLSNVGVGSALQIEINTISDNGEKFKGSLFETKRFKITSKNINLKPNEEIIIGVKFFSEYVEKDNVMVQLIYRDLFTNKWSQKVLMEISNEHGTSIIYIEPPKAEFIEDRLVFDRFKK